MLPLPLAGPLHDLSVHSKLDEKPDLGKSFNQLVTMNFERHT